MFHVGGVGVPEEVLQREVTDTKNTTCLARCCLFYLKFTIFRFKLYLLLLFPLNYRETTKAVMLEGIGNMKNLISYYVYDNNPAHFISMCCVTIFNNKY